MVTSVKETSHTPFSEEDINVVSKHDTSIVWAGVKVLYSGFWDRRLTGVSGMQQASGFNYLSGEADIEPINPMSGWGEIRIPELNQLHKLFVFPKNPTVIARVDYRTLTLGVTSGLPYGDGGCSGKIALVHYANICSGCASGFILSGEGEDYNSGLVDIIAFGSIN